MNGFSRGRFTAKTDEPFVVFVIGMRINRLRSVSKWTSVVRGLVSMLRYLSRYPEKGMLGSKICLSWRGLTLVQYWRSFEHLEKFARDASDPHIGAWREFNKMIGAEGSVGVWHESYLVEPGQFEAIYYNMPVTGLTAATEHVPAVGRRETARRRLGGESEPAVPTPTVAA
ncbi:DUF4188 domain-containing protein [Nitrolancea hollandica]|uniref:Uncharacterized protein n=1 Tax=Nitrolancea hollandica Lb TaxID=1129897 RepID=I4EI04_9BACT|nr:DUF4188 domain-containing protein [Nitrolancea hollandica]CCF84316.1 conserved hypothetical protein [Nitrolancea hollandica Lb]